MDIWQGMRERRVKIPLDTQAGGYHELWYIFLQVFLARPDSLYDYITHWYPSDAKSEDNVSVIYRTIMEQYILNDPWSAVEIFDLLKSRNLVPNKASGLILNYCIRTIDVKAGFRVFRHVYNASSERNLFDRCQDLLLQHNISKALTTKWLQFLLDNGDCPTPGIGKRSSKLASDVRRDRSDFIGIESLDNENTLLNDKMPDLPFTRAKFSSYLGSMHGISQKPISDPFCARIFATKGLSLGFIIAGLEMIGLTHLGPLAVREVAVKCVTTEEFIEALSELKTHKINLVRCIYSDALCEFARNDKQDLYDNLVLSDRHPDVYNDAGLLQRLIPSLLSQHRTQDVHALLTILSMFHESSTNFQWNNLLQEETSQGRVEKVQALVGEMLGSRIQISSASRLAIRRHILSPRNKSKSSQGFSEDLDMISNMFLSIMRSGQNIDATEWRELLKRYGMSGRLSALHDILLRLLSLYKDAQSPTLCNINDLFSPTMQRSIIAWGFHSAHRSSWFTSVSGRKSSSLATNKPLSPPYFLSGLSLLVNIHKQGFNLHIPSIRKELTTRLGMLYTPGISSKPSNRALKRDVQHSLLDSFDAIQYIWSTHANATASKTGNGIFDFKHDGTTESEREGKLYDYLFVKSGWLRKSVRGMQRRRREVLLPTRKKKIVNRQKYI